MDWALLLGEGLSKVSPSSNDNQVQLTVHNQLESSISITGPPYHHTVSFQGLLGTIHTVPLQLAHLKLRGKELPFLRLLRSLLRSIRMPKMGRMAIGLRKAHPTTKSINKLTRARWPILVFTTIVRDHKSMAIL